MASFTANLKGSTKAHTISAVHEQTVSFVEWPAGSHGHLNSRRFFVDGAIRHDAARLACIQNRQRLESSKSKTAYHSALVDSLLCWHSFGHFQELLPENAPCVLSGNVSFLRALRRGIVSWAFAWGKCSPQRRLAFRLCLNLHAVIMLML